MYEMNIIVFAGENYMKNERNRRVKILLERLQNKTIYLYGAGTRGRVALENLNALGLEKNVAGFLDDSREGLYKGKSVYPVECVYHLKDENTVFVITTYSVNGMVCKLMRNGISTENIYYFAELLISNVENELFQQNKGTIEQVYSMLGDSLSKYIYHSIFEVYLSGNIGILSRTKGNMQYFPVKGTNDEIEEFYLSENESFIDCGAYDGDTIRKFKIRTKNKYEKIWAFEPDLENFVKLSDYVAKEQDERVKLFQSGVYNKDTTMSFTSRRGTSSSLSQTGVESIEVHQIDSLINEPVTFIKMDIEGSEKEALLGGKRIIAEYKPKLAICIYHKIEDLWEIPQLIKKLNPSYHIYIRNYEDRTDETVCYAL